MSEFLDEVAGDCLEAEYDLGGNIMRWNGADYPVAQTIIARGATLFVGGNEVEIKLELRVRFAGTADDGSIWNFTARIPKAGEIVRYRRIDYRIAQADNAHDTFLQLHLMDVNR